MKSDTQDRDLDRLDRIWTGWVDLAPLSARVAQHRKERARFLAALRVAAEQAPVARILEVGCGSAIDLCLLAEGQGPGCRVAMDISAAAIGAAREFARFLRVSIDCIRGDVFTLPFRDGSFGLVFSQGLLEHFRNPAGVLREQVRVLAPDGLLAVSIPQTLTGYTLHKRRAMRRGTWPWGWEGDFTARRLARLGQAQRLEPLRVFGYQYWRSWCEPAWILRDLCGKFQRRNPLAAAVPFAQVARGYDRLWHWLERRYGHLFLQNVVAIFRKPIDQP